MKLCTLMLCAASVIVLKSFCSKDRLTGCLLFSLAREHCAEDRERLTGERAEMFINIHNWRGFAEQLPSDLHARTRDIVPNRHNKATKAVTLSFWQGDLDIPSDCSEFRTKLWQLTSKNQPFIHTYFFLYAKKTNGILGALSSRGHILATRSISLSFYLYQSFPPTLCTPTPHPNLSLSLSLLPPLPSPNLSLSVSFTTIYLSFLSTIYLSPSSILLSLWVLRCLI